MKTIIKYFLILLFLAVFKSEAFGALGISNLAATNITTTSAYFRASITGTNTVNPTNTLFYGTVDYTTNAASWAYSNVYGVAGTGNISTQITGLTAANKYYSRWLAQDGTSNIWTSTTTNFWTKPIAPTSTPTVVTISLQTDTNGLLKAPTNFWTANKTNIIAHVGLATGTPVYAETDPNWGAHSAAVVSAQGTVNNRSGTWDQAATDASVATNYLGTNTVQAQITANLTNQTASNLVYTAHVENTNNPHAVTPGQIGAVATNDPALTNARPWSSPDHTALTNVNGAADVQHLTAAEKAIATNPPSTNGLASQSWVTNQGYVTNLYSLTGMVSWVETVSVLTNLTLTGTTGAPIPDVTGVYTQITDMSGYPKWSNNNWYVWFDDVISYIIGTNGTGNASGLYWSQVATYPTGTYINVTGDKTGDITVAYSYVTNTATWRAGFNPATTNYEISRNGTNIYRAYAGSNVFDQPLYGDARGLTNNTKWDQAATDGSAATQYLGTNTVQAQLSAVQGRTGTWNQAATDASNATNRLTVLESTYQPYSATNYAVNGTVTVAYANGPAVKVTLTNDPTAIVFASGYPDNGINRVAINVYPGTNTSLGFMIGNVTNPTAITITNVNPAQLIFRTAGTNLPWVGGQIIR